MIKKIVIIAYVSFVFLFSFAIVNADQERIYLVEVKYNQGIVSFGEISTKLGYAPAPEKQDFMSENKYWIEVVAFNGKILEQRMFSIFLEINPEPPVEGEEYQDIRKSVLDRINELVILPYYKEGKTIKLYDENMRFISQKHIGYLADVCGDGICQNHESFESCAQDCAAAGKDDFCNEEKIKIDPDCEEWLLNVENESMKSNPRENSLIYIYIGLGLLLIGVSIIIILKIKRKNSIEV